MAFLDDKRFSASCSHNLFVSSGSAQHHSWVCFFILYSSLAWTTWWLTAQTWVGSSPVIVIWCVFQLGAQFRQGPVKAIGWLLRQWRWCGLAAEIQGSSRWCVVRGEGGGSAGACSEELIVCNSSHLRFHWCQKWQLEIGHGRSIWYHTHCQTRQGRLFFFFRVPVYQHSSGFSWWLSYWNFPAKTNLLLGHSHSLRPNEWSGSRILTRQATS